MGQQQLLLIVLGVIIVGIAVVVGINVFTARSVEANKSALVADLKKIGLMAQQYYRKPGAMGAFTGWTVPSALAQTQNMSAAVTANVAAQTVTLLATGTENGVNGSKITVQMKFLPDRIDSTTFPNP